MSPIVQVQQKGADEQGIRVQGDVSEPMEQEPATQKPIIGIIYPPPEVRNIVDKTASFVARNGPEFEARIRQNEANNSKFNFLSPTDPYHAYYRHKVKEFLEGKGQEPAAPKAPVKGTVKPAVAAVQDQFIPKDPPPLFEFMAEPPSISAYDLDVVRLTAQFVARNGRNFLTQLMQKETKNYQFDFLRPQHSLFQYFTKLVEQYTKILIPPKNLMAKLKIEGENPKKMLGDVKYRVEWTKHEDRIKAREKEVIEKERLAYSQIDWHDFVVVETVDFQSLEIGNFPTPVSINELGARLLQQERYEKYGDEGEKDDSDNEATSQHRRQQQQQQVESEEEESEEEEEAVTRRKDEPRVEQPQLVDMDMEESSDEEDESDKPQPLPPTSGDVIIRRGYNPKQRQQDSTEISDNEGKWMVSPLTGERVPANKLQEHMRYGLLDPNWKEQRKRQIAEKQQDEEVFAGGTDIEHALKGLAERRTDIFGVEETAIGKKVGEEEELPVDKVVWDGHSGSAENTQRKAAHGVTIDDQIEAIKKAQGFIMDESKMKIGPSSTIAVSTPAPVPQPPRQHNVVMAQQIQMVQIQQVPQQQVMTPVVVRPMINVVQRPQQVLVVQQPMMVQQQSSVVPVAPPQMMVQQNAPMLQQMQQQQYMHEPEAPPSKRQRTEANLIPEQQFLAHHHGPVSFRVMCPSADRADWTLRGQTLTFTLPLTDEVSVIKAKIHEATGMPGGKQKLQMDGLFIKDSNSLAFYNMNNGSIINLQIKERGGRKK